jgi:hypothetical protein
MSPTHSPLIPAIILKGFEPFPVEPPVPDREQGVADGHEGPHLPFDDAFKGLHLVAMATIVAYIPEGFFM